MENYKITDDYMSVIGGQHVVWLNSGNSTDGSYIQQFIYRKLDNNVRIANVDDGCMHFKYALVKPYSDFDCMIEYDRLRIYENINVMYMIGNYVDDKFCVSAFCELCNDRREMLVIEHATTPTLQEICVDEFFELYCSNGIACIKHGNVVSEISSIRLASKYINGLFWKDYFSDVIDASGLTLE